MSTWSTSRAGRQVPLIGVAGGIASGKSLVTDQFRALGAAVIDADTAAHDVLKLEEVKRLARRRWGAAIFDSQGEIDRPRLGKIVFAPPPAGPVELEYLEQLVHPRVRQLIEQKIEQLAADPQTPAIVLDVPLLFEAGWNKVCNLTVFVDAPREARLARAAQRGWTEDEFDRREAAQLALDRKRQQADTVIDNSTTRESAQAQVERLWHKTINPSEQT